MSLLRNLRSVARRLWRNEPLFRPYKFTRPGDYKIVHAASLRRAQEKAGEGWVYHGVYYERPALGLIAR